MDVICPNCKGPATQPIMQIYCKNECDRPKAVPAADSGVVYYVIQTPYGTKTCRRYKQPPAADCGYNENYMCWIAASTPDQDTVKTTQDKGNNVWLKYRHSSSVHDPSAYFEWNAIITL